MLDQQKIKRDLEGEENLPFSFTLSLFAGRFMCKQNKQQGKKGGLIIWFFLVTIPHDFIKCFGWDGEIEPPSVEWDNGKRANYNSFLIHDVDFYDRLAKWIKTEGLEAVYDGAWWWCCVRLKVFDHRRVLEQPLKSSKS